METLNDIANCELLKADIQASFLKDSDPSGNTNVEFTIPLETLTNKYGSKHFYATVVAVVGATGFSVSNHRHSYRLIYNSIQVNPNIRTVIDKSSAELKMVFIWIVIPIFIAIIIVVMALRHCIKGMRYNPIEDAVHLVEENPDLSVNPRREEDDTNPSTNTVLVEPKSN